MRTLTQLTAGALVVSGLASVAAAQAGVAAPESMQVVTDLKAVGVPLLSPDGRWAAVREAKGSVVVFSTADPSTRRSVPCLTPEQLVVEPAKTPGKTAVPRLGPPPAVSPWQWAQATPPAAFNADSSACIVGSPSGITRVAFAEGGMTVTRHEAPEHAVPVAMGRAGVWPLRWKAGGGYLMRLWSPAGGRGTPAGVAAPPAPVRWVEHPLTLVCQSRGGDDIIGLNAEDGELVALATRAEIQAAVGDAAQKPLGAIALLARSPKGTLLLEAQRIDPAPMRMRGPGYSAQLPADEKATRGRNPGSAEPRPPLPVYRLLKEGGRVQRLSLISKARWLDTWIEAPNTTLTQFLRLQVANEGSAGQGTPSVWTHLRLWPGEFEEHALGTAGLPAGLEAPRFEWLHSAPDARSGLVWMRGLRQYEFDIDDPEVRKKYLPDLPAGPQGRHLAVIFLMRRFERGGATGTTLSFGHFGVYRVEAAGKLTPVVSGLGEAIAPFDDDLDLPGNMNRPAYSAAARTLVASLYSGHGLDDSRGLVILTLPE